MELVNKINRSGDLANKLCWEGNVVNKAYRSGELIYQHLINEDYTPPENCIKITALNSSISGSVTPRVLEGSGSGYNLDDLNLEYSYDGREWFVWNYYWTPSNTRISIRFYDCVYIRGYNPYHFSKNYTTYFNMRFTKDVSVSGNIMGLIDYNNPPTEFPIRQNAEWFRNLFSDDYGEYGQHNAIHLMDVSQLNLPATTLTSGCYKHMFLNCHNINYIKCLATDISAQDCVYGWLDNVSATGTFIKNANMSGWETGASGIPEGWTVVDA